MKKTLIWFGSVVGAGAVMALVFMAINRPSIPKTITVSGECLTSAPKDKTAITLRVEVLADSTLESMRTATAQMAEITEFLKTQPVEVQTTQFNSYEKTEWLPLAIEITPSVCFKSFLKPFAENSPFIL